jgi:23S rRNA (adenine2503-C2)-methyltransferase
MATGVGTILCMELTELEGYLESSGEARFRARQVFQWMHQRGVFDVDGMKNLPHALRDRLSEGGCGLPLEVVETRESTYDGARKFVFRLEDGNRIESVLIPERDRLALCLSTQVGCAMGCSFCRTARMGLKRDLTAGEIVAQCYAVRDTLTAGRAITHVVFMGMGEPLANYSQTVRAIRIMAHPLGMGLSPRRITVSTLGIAPAMEALLREVQVNLTVSLNAPDETLRTELMPANRVHPLEEVIQALRRIRLPQRRRFTIAYVMLKGRNDTVMHASGLARRLHGIRCKINLIPFNPFPSSPLEASSEESVFKFQDMLRSKGFTTHVRVSKGRDILGACGQLATLPERKARERGYQCSCIV